MRYLRKVRARFCSPDCRQAATSEFCNCAGRQRSCLQPKPCDTCCGHTCEGGANAPFLIPRVRFQHNKSWKLEVPQHRAHRTHTVRGVRIGARGSGKVDALAATTRPPNKTYRTAGLRERRRAQRLKRSRGGGTSSRELRASRARQTSPPKAAATSSARLRHRVASGVKSPIGHF